MASRLQPAAEQTASLWDAAEASAAKWSARLHQALSLPDLSPAQRTILEGRLAIIQDYLRQREPVLLNQDNMHLWIEGTLARWGLAGSLPPATEPLLTPGGHAHG